ncbi:MAG TPA: putative quinol monooxygenase [Gemmatimonadales bacterium]
MSAGRREFIASALALAVVGPSALRASTGERQMHGLIGRMTAVPGKRDELVRILLDGVAGMPGCLSYVVATDPADEDAIWITEVWDSRESHHASLSLPSVRDAITKGRPLIADFAPGTVTVPVGGHGLVR